MSNFNHSTQPCKPLGFTLIEVLIALAVIAIAFTALIQSSAASIKQTQSIKNKIISHLVMQQGIVMLQLSLATPDNNITHKTKMLDQSWYWRISVSDVDLPSIKHIQIRASLLPAGPFNQSLSGYLYAP